MLTLAGSQSFKTDVGRQDDDREMKHTVYNNVKVDGDIVTLRTAGPEGIVKIALPSVRKVKLPFPTITVETGEKIHRLDLRNLEPSEYAEAKRLFTAAMKKNQAANNEGVSRARAR